MSDPNQMDQDPARTPLHSVLWRKIIAAASDYEIHLQSGQDTDPEAFASRYTEIPLEILTAELHRLRDEIQSAETYSPLGFDHRYVELERLGSGGMGEIYRGIDQECHRPVAIKKIRREFQNDPETRTRFHAEAELTASLEHPGIIPIYGRGIDPQGRDYYAMRLVSGEGAGTFAQSIQQFHDRHFANAIEQSWALRDLIRRLVDIADTIAYAHNQQIVHRDLKPSNILIGPYGETLIADWGLARRIKPSAPQRDISQRDIPQRALPTEGLGSGSSATPGLGTPGYRAPDANQGTSEQALRSADIYSLGAMLICVLTNHPPGEQQDGSLGLTDIPGIESLKAIAARATASNWQDRYSTVAEFRSDLLRWIAGEPVSARPEGWGEQAIRWLSRHRTAATSLASALAITLVGGVLFLVYQTEQNRIISTQAGNLQIALDESARLLKETQKANEVAETRRIEADKNRELAEKRESLAYRGLLKFQDLLVTNQQIFQSPQLASLNDTLSQQSKDIFEAILNVLRNDSPPNPETVARLSLLTRRLSSMDMGLGKHQQSNELIEQACKWLQNSMDNAKRTESFTEANADSIRMRIGQLRAFQATQIMRQGKLPESRNYFQIAIDLITPLIQRDTLNAEDHWIAKLTLMEAWSGISMHEVHHGDLNRAKEFQRKALDWMQPDRPANTEEALGRMQVYGNISILHEKLGETVQAIRNLELAAQCVEEAFGMITENPAGFPSEDSIVLPPVELVAIRSQLAQQQVRLLIANQDLESATQILTDLVKKESESLRLLPINSLLVGFYLRTATNLHTLLINTGKQSRAMEFYTEWLDLAQSMVEMPSASEPHWLLLIHAHHSAGHLFQQMQQVDLASEKYGRAIEGCQEALKREYRTAKVLYQMVELWMHQFQLQVASQPLDQIEPYYQNAVEAAEQLMRLPPTPEVQRSTALAQLQSGIEMMRKAGHAKAADRWQEVLKSKQLMP